MGLFDRAQGREMPETEGAPDPSAAAGESTPVFAVLDVETTGLSPAAERIIELAIVRADAQGRAIDQWVTRLDPGRSVGATHVHGLRDADVAGAPTFAELAVTIGSVLQGMVVVAHNAEFDLAFLRAEFARVELPMPQCTTYCTLQGSTLYLPHLPRRRLGDCCAALGIPLEHAHSALGDARATAGLLQRYLALDAQTGYDAPLTATRARPTPAAISEPDLGRRTPSGDGAFSDRTPRSGDAEPAPRAAGEEVSPAAPMPHPPVPAGLVITEEFRAALDHLHAGHHLFLTGKAGTGKSTLIRHYLETTERRTLTVAPTGIAALNVDGYTIHRLFSFPIGVSEEMVRGGGYYPGRFATALKELDTLIIDEASMVRADLFDALTAALERFGPEPGAPFGGVQLVLVGDLYQLPPVVTDAESAWIEERFGTPFFFSARSFDAATFPVVELGTVFRQQGDDRLVDLLNAVREGALLEEARAELNARTAADFEPPLEEFWLTLATTNRIVGARNRTMLERLPEAPQTFPAQITGQTDGFEHPTEERLQLAVGAQVMLLTNDPSQRWVNGTLGRVTGIGADADGPVVTVQLRGGESVSVRPHTWDITRPSVQGGALVHEVIGTFTQLPMKLAWAITIHKSQGQTLDRVVVDLTGGTFANGQLYVALSRCTSLEGLVLRREVLPRDLKTDRRVRRYLQAGATTPTALGEAYLAVLSVGTSGDRWRPRPIEIAVVTDEGDAATTVVNPTSDLFSAATDYGLTARDVQLAPVLAEAWPALGSLLAGRVPVGRGVDQDLALIDFELKRNGIVQEVPLGLELPRDLLTHGELERLQAPTALARARALREARARLHAEGTALPGAGTAFPQRVPGTGYLLARTTGTSGTTEPTGFVVGGNLSAEDDPAAVLAEHLRTAWSRVPRPEAAVLERLRAAEEHYGVRVLPEDVAADAPVDLAAVLVPGARICFTGTVDSPRFGALEKEDLHRLAARCGLEPVPTLTKTRTDVLVVAEAGSQSRKAKDAARWEKPVIVAEEFLEWAG
ncbi:exonuclease domain-containing protein [Brachybacterium sp. YJGR34]|uniref:exonuclease domain-containing protein n=1 Tax=Brachybacterium sp. YJGR34 TaxID=2059911 RepID=UPI002100CCB8|nr:exonuclease domain-containing protein [Brachybacterium sp. YJGR34]